MPSNLPPLLALQAFEATARHENFTVAAQELNLSQSAVSHRVRTLERYLGCPLFERLPRGLRLTESAKAYLPSLRRAFEDIVGSTSGVFGSHAGSSLSIRAPVTYASLWLSAELDRFSVAYPQIEIHLTSSIWTEKLAVGETDIDLRLGDGGWPGYETDYLFNDPLVPVCRPKTIEDAGSPLELVDIAHRPLVHVMSTENHWDRYFSAHGVARQSAFRDRWVDSSLSAAQTAATSNCFALIQTRFARHFVKTGELAIAHPGELEIDQAMYLLLPETSGRRKPEVILFRDWLLETIQPT